MLTPVSGRFEYTSWGSGAIYVAKFPAAVYVLHAFQKKSQKTRKEDIELARARYRQIGGRL